MKIKTSSTAKTAPSPPPSPGPLPAPVPACRRRARCCSTWTCCDYVLVFMLVTGVVVLLAGGAAYKYIARKHAEDPSYHSATEYYRGKCRVADIIDQGPVCCAGNGDEQCKAGMNGDLSMDDGEWYQFKDEATNNRASRDMMEEWEAIEEYEREEWERMEDSAEGGEKDDDEDDDTLERKKRSGRMQNKNKSFACYKIVLEGWSSDEDDEGGLWDYLLGGRSDEEWDRSEEYSSEGSSSEEHHRRGGYHGKGHHKGHHGGHHSRERRDDLEEQRRALMEEKREMEERMGLGEEMMDPKPEGKPEGKPELQGEQPYKPEGGIVLLADAEPVDGVYTTMFYDSETTMKHYTQCSYSACMGKRCQSTVDIEEKMRKWRARMDNDSEFDCSVHEDYMYTTWGLNMRHHRFVRIMILPFVAFMITIFVIFIVRRVRACKLRREQCRSFRAANMAISQEKYAVTPETTEKTMTKEEEANLPPSAPPMVWTIPTSVPLPAYGKGPEMPPAYKSTADLMEAWAKMEEDEEKKKPSDSEA